MTYKFLTDCNDAHYITEKHSHRPIAYYPKQKMSELYQNGGYEVIGEIGNSIERYLGIDEILLETGESIPIFPRGSVKKPFEWVIGYSAVGENSYVAVIKNIIPL